MVIHRFLRHNKYNKEFLLLLKVFLSGCSYVQPVDFGAMNSYERLIFEVQQEAHREISYRSDIKNYGKSDVWGMAENGYGDCEDFVYVKMQKLIKRGYPKEKLHPYLCRPDSGNGTHMVLLVSTDTKAYILDNQYVNPYLATESTCRFIHVGQAEKPLGWKNTKSKFISLHPPK